MGNEQLFDKTKIIQIKDAHKWKHNKEQHAKSVGENLFIYIL